MRMLLATVCILAGSTLAHAQYGVYQTPNYGPGYRPNLSPYLNLVRSQNNRGVINPAALAADYYLGTRPELQRRRNAQEFRDALLDERERNDEPRLSPVESGTSTTINNTTGYFNNTFGYYGNTNPPNQTARRNGRPVRPARGGGASRPGTAPTP